MYLAIDPGAHPGFAFLKDDLSLLCCGTGEPISGGQIETVLAERPTIYPNSKASPENIITLAITLGKMLRRYEDMGCKIVLVEPRTWKGQIPKKQHHAAIRKQLRPDELAIVDACLKNTAAKWCEDAMDAVGLALYGRRMHIFR